MYIFSKITKQKKKNCKIGRKNEVNITYLCVTYWSQGRATSLSLSKCLLISFGSIHTCIQLSLSLPKLCKVKSSNLLCLLNLLLVGADLTLELVNQSLVVKRENYFRLSQYLFSDMQLQYLGD